MDHLELTNSAYSIRVEMNVLRNQSRTHELSIFISISHARMYCSRGDQTSNIWISRWNGIPVTSSVWWGLPFTPMKTCLKFWGLPWKLVWNIRGLPWSFFRNFGSCNDFKSELLRPWVLLFAMDHEELTNLVYSSKSHEFHTQKHIPF